MASFHELMDDFGTYGQQFTKWYGGGALQRSKALISEKRNADLQWYPDSAILSRP